jgi:tetratricopeptide (TPR) repeat protein
MKPRSKFIACLGAVILGWTLLLQPLLAGAADKGKPEGPPPHARPPAPKPAPAAAPLKTGYAGRIQAGLLIKQGQVDKGLKLYGELVQKEPKNLDLRADYADALLNQKQYPQLAKQLKALKRQGPNNERVRFLEAQYLLETGEHQKALEALRLLIDQDPKRPEYLNAYGRAQQKAGNPEEAMAAYRRSLLYRANQPWLRRDLMRMTKEGGAKLTSRMSYADQDRTVKFLRSEMGLMGPVAHGLKAGLRWHSAEIERERTEFAPPVTKNNHRVMAAVEYRAAPGLTVGVSGGPALVGPSVLAYGGLVRYVIPETARIEFKTEINYPWDDPIDAAERDGVVDRYALSGEFTGIEKWVVNYNLEWREYFLDKDAKYADRFIASSSIGRVLLAHPFLLLSYNFYYSDVRQRDESAQELLIAKENSHGLSLYLEGQFSSYISGWFTAGVRRDNNRDLNSYEFGLGFRWLALPRLNVMPSYYYSNDSQTVGGGDSHTFILETEYLL